MQIINTITTLMGNIPLAWLNKISPPHSTRIAANLEHFYPSHNGKDRSGFKTTPGAAISASLQVARRSEKQDELSMGIVPLFDEHRLGVNPYSQDGD